MPKENTRPKFISISEVARLLGCSRSHVRKMCKSGKLASKRFGDKVLIPASEIDRLMDEAMKSLISE